MEGAPSVLPPFDPKLQRYTQLQLEKMGVEVRLNTLAVDMDHDSITVKGPGGLEIIRTKNRIWAAGVQASPWDPEAAVAAIEAVASQGRTSHAQPHAGHAS